MNPKTVQIPYEIFIALCKYHLVGIEDDKDAICNALQEKLNALMRRDYYSKAHNSDLSERERQDAMQKYIDSIR